MSNFAAVYVSKTGKEITMPLVLDRARDKIFVQQNGVWIEFADEIDSAHGSLALVETIPSDPMIRPRSTSRIRHLAEIGL